MSFKRLKAISKIGFWFKIRSSPSEKRGFAETGAAGTRFPAMRDFPSGQISFVGLRPLVRLRRIEDLKPGTNKETCPPLANWAKRYF
jgi:hypothetical protein